MKTTKKLSTNGPRALERERAKIAQQIGEEAGALAIIRPEWSEWMKQGVLVKLHLRRWRAQAKLDFVDLGLPDPKDAAERKRFRELMTFGVKWLLPSKYVDALGAIDSGARKHLDKYSHDLHWGKFVPFTAYAEWKEGNCNFEQRYFAMRDEIYERFDAIVAELEASYRSQAQTAYRNLKRLRPKLLELKSGRVLTEAEFVERYMQRVEAAIPERESVRDSFAYETELSFIPLPALLEQDLLERERIAGQRRKEEAQRGLVEAKQNVERARVSARRRAEAERARIEAEALSERERMERRALAERERQLDAMNADVLREARLHAEEQAREQLELIAAQTRTQIYEALVNVLESVDRNDGILVGKAAEQLRGIVSHAELMNFTGDLEIAGQIRDVRQVLNAEKRSQDQVRSLLEKLVRENRMSLESLNQTPLRRARRGSTAANDTEAETPVRAERRGRRGGLGATDDE